MLGFGLGGVVTGKITDRFGIVTAMALSIGFLGSAYVSPDCRPRSGNSSLVHFLIGLGSSATFGR
jgi:MFS family permease